MLYLIILGRHCVIFFFFVYRKQLDTGAWAVLLCFLFLFLFLVLGLTGQVNLLHACALEYHYIIITDGV